MDLSNLHKGIIYDGNSYFYFNKNKTDRNNFELLEKYLGPTKNAENSSLISMILPTAHAEENKQTSRSSEGLIPKSPIIRGITKYIGGGGTALAIPVSLLGLKVAIGGGITAGIAAFSAIALAAAIASEFFYKLGHRVSEGKNLRCINDQLYFSYYDKKSKVIDPEISLHGFESYFLNQYASSAELFVRDQLCKNTDNLAKLEDMIKENFSALESGVRKKVKSAKEGFKGR